MFSKPTIKSYFRCYAASDRTLILSEDRSQKVIDGAIFVKLVPLLDGTRTLSDILAELAGAFSPPQIFVALDRLARGGITTEGDGLVERRGASFIQRFAERGSDANGRLAKLAVSVRSVGGLDVGPMLEALRLNELRVTEDGADLSIVLASDYLLPELEAINQAALAQGSAWMLVKPIGFELWIGPILEPGKTGCWACIAQRLKMNRQVDQYLEAQKAINGPIVASRVSNPSTLSLGAALAASEVVKWAISPEKSDVLGHIRSIDLTSRVSERHVLIRRPQYPACGSISPAEEHPPSPPKLESRKKLFTQDGGHRTRTPIQTYELYKHHLSRILGVVTELMPSYSQKMPLVPSFIAGHNFSLGSDNLIILKQTLRGSSGGKGASEIQARVSALCEAIERYSGNYQGYEASRRGSLAELAPMALHPNDVMGFSQEQTERWFEPHPIDPTSRCVLVPRPFDTEAHMDWAPLWSMTNEGVRYLPSSFCYYGHPEFRKHMSVFPDSNGCAAGNSLEEAFLQGFMELVERDAAALWWYNRVQRSAVDLDSFELPYVDAIRDFYETLGRDLWVIDITSDLPIPVFACISPLRKSSVEDIILGLGAHFDPKIALLRAITEVNQFLPSLLLRNPDGSTRYLYADGLAGHWWKTARLAENPHLSPRRDRPAVRHSDIKDLSRDDLLDDVRTCVELCRERDMEVLFMDQTRTDIGLNVVRVVVPELCHFWRRLGKTRLWETPVKQGWRDTALGPDTCNPYTIFF